ncbi:MAG TPA: hypothetical protein VER03_07720, partial [Bryobacteraceae bacterium]|nr:hypothetical protein [Bryobacteraceae bacterium]
MTRLFFAVLMAALSSTMLQAVEQPLAFGSVRFEENRGQTDSQVQYAARTRTHQVFVTAKDVVFSPAAGPAIRMDFGGARPARWRPAGEAVDSISYYIGKDPAKWVKGAPMFDRLVWRGAYPGIDVMLYSRGEKIEYDLVLAPGADPSRVRLRFTGADRVDCDSSGAIEIGP